MLPGSNATSLIERAAQGSVLLAIACSVVIGCDVVRRPQKMAVMNWVWPLTALYSGPLGLAAYIWMGRAPARTASAGARTRKPPFWRSVLVGSLHCGAGCTLGDILSEVLVFATGLTLFNSRLATDFAAAFLSAYAAGLVFQFFAIAPMQGLGFKAGLIAAAKADTLSLVAYEMGMFAWMGFTHTVLFPSLEPDRWLFWLMMQVAMLVGLATTYPINWWLIRSGVKEAM